MFTKDARFNDLKTKIRSCETKKSKLITILVFLVSMSGFSQAHHEHDANGNHESY
jgi:mRNA-degrading endonuclease YafQ of YafQ-DinJ toxin-antitoxin module